MCSTGQGKKRQADMQLRLTRGDFDLLLFTRHMVQNARTPSARNFFARFMSMELTRLGLPLDRFNLFAQPANTQPAQSA